MVSIAVLGTGSIGMRHLGFLQQIPGVSAVAVPKRPHRVAELIQQGITAVCDIDEAAIIGATACVISSETGQHVQDCLAALENGFDILVEKPLATHAAEAQKVARFAKEKGRRVFVGCVMRFSESLTLFKKSLAEAGQLHSVQIEAQSFLPEWQPDRPYLDTFRARSGEGGVLLDLVHEIDYAGWLFGWPISVQGRVRNLGRLGIYADEAAECNWEIAGDCSVSVVLDFLTRIPRRRMRVNGDMGSLEWDAVAGTVTINKAGSPSRIKTSHQSRNAMFLAQTQAFVEALDGNYDSRLATCGEGVKGVAVCDAVRKSSDTRREEMVDYQ